MARSKAKCAQYRWADMDGYSGDEFLPEQLSGTTPGVFLTNDCEENGLLGTILETTPIGRATCTTLATDMAISRPKFHNREIPSEEQARSKCKFEFQRAASSSEQSEGSWFHGQGRGDECSTSRPAENFNLGQDFKEQDKESHAPRDQAKKRKETNRANKTNRERYRKLAGSLQQLIDTDPTIDLKILLPHLPTYVTSNEMLLRKLIVRLERYQHQHAGHYVEMSISTPATDGNATVSER